MRYQCIDSFALSLYDENGYITDNYMDVEEGSIWNLSEDEYRFCANKDNIRLEHDDGRWLEITKNDFKRYFEQLEREEDEAL